MKPLLKIFLLIALLAIAGWFLHRAGHLPLPERFTGPATEKSAAQGPPPAAGGFGPMPVEARAVESRDLAVAIDTVGTLSASESADIRAEIAGAVKSTNFSEGHAVKKGDSLFEIDDSLIRAELMKAEATYNVRKTVFARNDKLKTSGFIASQDWEQSQGSLREAAADMESARIRLEKTKVLAPFDGLAGLRNVSIGDYVEVGQLMTTLDAIDPVKITFSIPEKNYSDIKPGQKISFFVDAWPEESFTGEIYAISPRVDQQTRNFEVKAKIPNAEGRLRPGMFARVSIVISIHLGALVILEQAVIPTGEDSFVFVVRDGKAVWQKIAVGLRQTGIVEIKDGLSAGEPVVVAGTMKIQDGMPVMVMPAAGMPAVVEDAAAAPPFDTAVPPSLDMNSDSGAEPAPDQDGPDMNLGAGTAPESQQP